MTGGVADLRLRMVKETGALGAEAIGVEFGGATGGLDEIGRIPCFVKPHLSELDAIANSPPSTIKNGSGNVKPCTHW